MRRIVTRRDQIQRAPSRLGRPVEEREDPALVNRGIRIRAGVHIGECERRGDEWSGMAVHIGARIGALAGEGEVPPQW
jgi:class 3 adenylate cyclase